MVTRQPGQLLHQRLGPGRQLGQQLLDLGPIREGVQSIGSGAQLARVCGPRSNSTVISAFSGADRPSSSSGTWWYFSTRETLPAHTVRISPRSLSSRSRVISEPSS